MLDDCQANQLDIIFTKSMSRFGRDTIEALAMLIQSGLTAYCLSCGRRWNALCANKPIGGCWHGRANAEFMEKRQQAAA